ncbi:hypothetical protein [Nonomuraea turcica]|uniref:hypothetical protein n=1 Tax=Nonomuraea sp. G32 TaxID=3067274 RepID=UPI00273C3943|nr:hypothetical protein [Nonomuraea sp. G32]MDP4501096.1 hypothetical protein [Nonomuraea sp. G32]
MMAPTCCPRCSTPLNEGPVLYRCGNCRRAVPAADLDTEFHAHTARQEVAAHA